MAEVWKRPGLTGMEIGWRCVLWLPIYSIFAVALGGLGMDLSLTSGPLASATWFKPAAAVVLFSGFAKGVLMSAATHRLVVESFFIYVLWLSVAAFMRAVILRRIGSGLTARWGVIWVLQAIRSTVAAGYLLLWFAVCLAFEKNLLAKPMAAGGDPNVVLAFAAVVLWTLVMFVVWCTVGWVFQAAPVVSMERGLGVFGSFREVWRNGPLREKLIEINLVMGIVKVCLLVLALVFSACPLPFSNVETQSFLDWWWFGVFVFWVVASDYFHVVRSAAYLRLWEAYKIP